MAIKRKPLPLHLEIQRHRGNPVGLIRSSYRENGKVKHSTHGRITGLTLEQLKLLQAAFRGDVVPKGSAEDFQILASKEYGASYALLYPEYVPFRVAPALGQSQSHDLRPASSNSEWPFAQPVRNPTRQRSRRVQSPHSRGHIPGREDVREEKDLLI